MLCGGSHLARRRPRCRPSLKQLGHGGVVGPKRHVPGGLAADIYGPVRSDLDFADPGLCGPVRPGLDEQPSHLELAVACGVVQGRPALNVLRDPGPDTLSLLAPLAPPVPLERQPTREGGCRGGSQWLQSPWR